MPKVIQIEHPDLDGTVEVNDDTLADWEAVGWKRAAQPKTERAASAPRRKKHAAPTEEGE